MVLPRRMWDTKKRQQIRASTVLCSAIKVLSASGGTRQARGDEEGGDGDGDGNGDGDGDSDGDGGGE